MKTTVMTVIVLVISMMPMLAAASSVPSVKDLKAYQSNYSQASIVKWSKVAKADGYQVQRKAKGGTYKTVKTITKNSTTRYTSGQLTAGKTYYYRVRAYQKTKSGKIYSSYKYATGFTIKGTKIYTLPANGELYMERLGIGCRIKTDGRLNLPSDTYPSIIVYLHDDFGGVITSFVLEPGESLYISKANHFTDVNERLYWQSYEIAYIRLYTDIDVDSTVAVR